ncbi:uncharacterized protein F4822DRAFT_271590 [Hypoxylon trugodes]|uniref:uncharacterized protein n=1 Tax=Hypoxylon trugodes TaxID=326681 RepID=UPI0021A1DC50|nr:uncharacterized protein F4822DRAFT_271590 [Hypoxylon trugodes]KAI1389167.1 hypothetical protein F4822DRAFT_271590 [Hypoxylon trugodes]
MESNQPPSVLPSKIMIPEILFIICSFLEIEDLIRARLSCKALADIGACYAFREIVFCLHPDDLDMLRYISLHSIASRNVHSLVYIGHTIGQPQKTFNEFRNYYATNRTGPAEARLDIDQLRRRYEKYKRIAAEEDKMLRQRQDFAILREAIPRFVCLREVTMSTDFWF